MPALARPYRRLVPPLRAVLWSGGWEHELTATPAPLQVVVEEVREDGEVDKLRQRVKKLELVHLLLPPRHVREEADTRDREGHARARGQGEEVREHRRHRLVRVLGACSRCSTSVMETFEESSERYLSPIFPNC